MHIIHPSFQSPSKKVVVFNIILLTIFLGVWLPPNFFDGTGWILFAAITSTLCALVFFVSLIKRIWSNRHKL